MAQYLIPQYRLGELGKQINKIRNKGANVTFEIIDPLVNIPVNVNGRQYDLPCSRVEVEGSYRMNGWDFVGTIQHASPENIIRLADNRFEGRVPERYRTAEKECEHCHIRRDRNDTFLVYNEDEDEFRQVGRTCLRNYTQGLDAETCAGMMSVIAELNRLNAAAQAGEVDGDLEQLLRTSVIRYRMDKAKKQAYNYVVANGYTPGETGNAFRTELGRNADQMTEATDAQVQAVEEWLRTLPSNDWARNALAAWTKDSFEPRDAGLITSAVASYLRHVQQEQARQNRLNAADNDYAGQIGDKVTFTVDSASVAYWRDGGSYYSSYRYPVYKFVATDGKIYSWGCTKEDYEPTHGDVIQGTVKAHRELRNGDKCTEITRGKILEKQPRYRGFQFN